MSRGRSGFKKKERKKKGKRIIVGFSRNPQMSFLKTYQSMPKHHDFAEFVINWVGRKAE